MRKILATIVPILFLAACAFNQPTQRADSIPATPQQCYWNWANQSLPDITAQVQSSLDTSGLKGVVATAQAFGENCIDLQTNKPASFAIMETDFHFTAQVADPADKTELGNLLEKILVVLDNFPAGKIPGARPGYVNISFQTGKNEVNLSVNITAGKAARARGLHGAALFDEFEKK